MRAFLELVIRANASVCWEKRATRWIENVARFRYLATWGEMDSIERFSPRHEGITCWRVNPAFWQRAGADATEWLFEFNAQWHLTVGSLGRERRNKLSECCRADEKSLSGRKRSGGLSLLLPFSFLLSLFIYPSIYLSLSSLSFTRFHFFLSLSHSLSPRFDVVSRSVEEGIINENSTRMHGYACWIGFWQVWILPSNSRSRHIRKMNDTHDR